MIFKGSGKGVRVLRSVGNRREFFQGGLPVPRPSKPEFNNLRWHFANDLNSQQVFARFRKHLSERLLEVPRAWNGSWL